MKKQYENIIRTIIFSDTYYNNAMNIHSLLLQKLYNTLLTGKKNSEIVNLGVGN